MVFQPGLWTDQTQFGWSKRSLDAWTITKILLSLTVDGGGFQSSEELVQAAKPLIGLSMDKLLTAE